MVEVKYFFLSDVPSFDHYYNAVVVFNLTYEICSVSFNGIKSVGVEVS